MVKLMPRDTSRARKLWQSQEDAEEESELVMYVDAKQGGENDERCPASGIVVCIPGAPLLWRSADGYGSSHCGGAVRVAVPRVPQRCTLSELPRQSRKISKSKRR